MATSEDQVRDDIVAQVNAAGEMRYDDLLSHVQNTHGVRGLNVMASMFAAGVIRQRLVIGNGERRFTVVAGGE